MGSAYTRWDNGKNWVLGHQTGYIMNEDYQASGPAGRGAKFRKIVRDPVTKTDAPEIVPIPVNDTG